MSSYRSARGEGLYRRIYLFFIHARSQDGGTFLALVAGGIPCFPVTLLWGFVYNCIVMKAGRTGEPDNVPVLVPITSCFKDSFVIVSFFMVLVTPD